MIILYSIILLRMATGGKSIVKWCYLIQSLGGRGLLSGSTFQHHIPAQQRTDKKLLKKEKVKVTGPGFVGCVALHNKISVGRGK